MRPTDDPHYRIAYCNAVAFLKAGNLMMADQWTRTAKARLHELQQQGGEYDAEAPTVPDAGVVT